MSIGIVPIDGVELSKAIAGPKSIEFDKIRVLGSEDSDSPMLISG